MSKKIRIVSFIIIPIWFIGINFLGVCFSIDKLWGNMFEDGFSNLAQWISLIIYRMLIYILPALIIALIKFDRRMKYLTRVIVSQNWVFCIYLICKVVIEVFALNIAFNIQIFNSLDSTVVLAGYVFTYIKKKEIDFSENGAVLGEKPYN